MMATTSSTAKNKPDNQNLTRSRSLGPKPKQLPSSEPKTTTDGSGRKQVEKPLPNYLKPTASSRPDPVKFLRKNKAVQDNPKLLRRRSFDRPLSSSSTHKPLNTSPQARPRDKPAVPRENPVTGLRSTAFHGSSRGGLRGSTTVKSPPVASRGPPGVKKSGLSGNSSSKKEEKGELVNEEQIEERKEPENTEENSSEDKEVVEKRVDVEENNETVVTPDMKEAEIEAEAKEEESEGSKVKEGTTETKKEVVKGKKGSPTAYNDVIASKMQESSRKNKVLALAGAFQTVIDYETAASK
ncbi:hypothetical protein DY000_02019311 [Brassica cretica]|uniref:Calmodulin-binding domain-containing protein n=1 Tax=Brassica cretica TaxID=69181 RepID=A0ABQ7CNY2_BRACR|nr:hypothetical protein DY000_02019311 [Brassica cretica]